jgi:AmmeMemoRadiSam system protein B
MEVVMNRRPVQAGYFYPDSKNACEELLQKCIPVTIEKPPLPTPIVAGIVPHAGWVFSGPTAGKVYRAIWQKSRPETFVIFGAVHVWNVSQAAIWTQGSWETPLGVIKIDEELAMQILKLAQGLIVDHSEAHLREHSIEVQIPFIQHLFPHAKVVPIMVSSFSEAHKVGEYVASVASDKVVVVGSTDMTHYGSHYHFTPMGTGAKSLAWAMEDNDQRMIELMLAIEPEKVVPEAMTNYNACGSGAIAATLGYARSLGKKNGVLLEHTTSWHVDQEPLVDSFVGYAGVVF